MHAWKHDDILDLLVGKDGILIFAFGVLMFAVIDSADVDPVMSWGTHPMHTKEGQAI